MSCVRVVERTQTNTILKLLLEEKLEKVYSNVDYHCLKMYDENNEHFSMAIITEKQDGEQEEKAIGYNCIYNYEKSKVKFEFDITNGLWKVIPFESNQHLEQILDSIFDEILLLPLEEQIQMIIKHYDQYFTEIDRKNQEVEYENKMLISGSLFKNDNEIKQMNNELIELNSQKLSTSLAIPEDDEQQKDIIDYGFHGFITGSRNNKFSGLAPPPVAPRRSRQNSACSTQSSVRYASFIPPPTAPVRRRRVIESILVHVQRKKKPFEKIVALIKGTEIPTMSDLGLEFLRVYDGRFNYREGHTFVMSFRKKTWFLTIEQIKCVDCAMNEFGPRSLLILSYKGQCTTVHV